MVIRDRVDSSKIYPLDLSREGLHSKFNSGFKGGEGENIFEAHERLRLNDTNTADFDDVELKLGCE